MFFTDWGGDQVRMMHVHQLVWRGFGFCWTSSVSSTPLRALKFRTKTTSYIGVVLAYSQNFVMFIISLNPCNFAYSFASLAEVNF